MMKRFGMVASAVLSLAVAAGEPVKVIFDTDMYADVDDAGALACLHALADAGECEILATVSCTRDCLSVAMCEVVNAYYGRPDIPVGCVKGIGVCGDPKGMNRRVYGAVVEKYATWVRHRNSSDAPDAAEIYRSVLSAQPDQSVVICSVGFLSNLRKLVESDRDLVVRKVKRWVAMACFYPKGAEFNAKSDWPSSKIALANWPTPIVFTDFQYGMDCFAGRLLAESAARDNPVADVFRGTVPGQDSIACNPAHRLCGFNGAGGRAAWDETAVLVAVRGTEPYFNVHRGSYRMIGETGEDEWSPDEENGPHLRITEKVDKRDVGRLIDELMCRPPARMRLLRVPQPGRLGARPRAERADCRRGHHLAAADCRSRRDYGILSTMMKPQANRPERLRLPRRREARAVAREGVAAVARRQVVECQTCRR